MKNLPSFLFLSVLLTLVVNQSLCARPLHDADRSITFFIDDDDILSHTASTVPPVIGNGGQVPFADPVGLFHRNGGGGGGGPRSRSSSVWLPFLTSLEALESGNVTLIDQELPPSLTTGKVQGIYVTCSEEDNRSHMVAIRSVFGGRGSVDSLRFFGEHRTGLSESHVAVVGGTGRYDGANGYAVVKEVGRLGTATKRKLKFLVYIK